MEQTVIKTKKKKIRFFYLLLILSFLGSGVALFHTIFSLFEVDFLRFFFKNLPLYESLFIHKIEGSLFFEILKMLLFLINIFAIVLLWKRLKPGFYLYVIAQFLLLSLPFLFAMHLPFMQVFAYSLPDIIFTISFILLYLLYYNELSCPLKKKTTTE